MQTLDARHIELFLSEGYRDGSWEYQIIGSHDIKKHADVASACIFDFKHLNDSSTSGNSICSIPTCHFFFCLLVFTCLWGKHANFSSLLTAHKNPIKNLITFAIGLGVTIVKF